MAAGLFHAAEAVGHITPERERLVARFAELESAVLRRYLGELDWDLNQPSAARGLLV